MLLILSDKMLKDNGQKVYLFAICNRYHWSQLERQRKQIKLCCHEACFTLKFQIEVGNEHQRFYILNLEYNELRG